MYPSRRELIFAGLAAAGLSRRRAADPPLCASDCGLTANNSALNWNLHLPPCFDDNIHLGDGEGLQEYSPPGFVHGMRRNYSSLSPDEVRLLASAYQAIQSDVSAQAKVTWSIGVQTYLHEKYCAGGMVRGGIHVPDGGLFLAWHRAFLVFHERLLQWALIQKCGVDQSTAMAVRLPYWEPTTSMGAYSTAAALQHQRTISSEGLPPKPINALIEPDLTKAAGLILDWHNCIHNRICGDFNLPRSSAFDPLFYAFHSYVDLMWESSKVQGQIKLTPNPWWGIYYDPFLDTDPGDRTSGWRKVNIGLFTRPADWGYDYDGLLKADVVGTQPAIDISNVHLPDSDRRDYVLVAHKRRTGIETFWPFPIKGETRTLAGLPVFADPTPSHVHDYPFARVPVGPDFWQDSQDGKWDFTVEATNGGKKVSASVPASSLEYKMANVAALE